MGIIDLRTIIFSQMITYAICTLVITSLWRQYRKHYRGLSFWLADFVLQETMILPIGLWGRIPELSDAKR